MSVNAILYRPGSGRWAMTERGGRDLSRSAHHLAIGPSSLRWRAGRLAIELDERTFPLPGRLRGTIEIETGPIFHETHRLDLAGRHRWRPVAPLARMEARFEAPAINFAGHAYVDMNSGDEPLEDGFERWTWSRSALPGGGAAIFYDVTARRTPGQPIANRYDADGTVSPIAPPPLRPLPGTLWRVARSARSDDEPLQVRTLEDTPFYTRTALLAGIDGKPSPTICESVDLDRFAARWVQALLPFRMPRRAR